MTRRYGTKAAPRPGGRGDGTGRGECEAGRRRATGSARNPAAPATAPLTLHANAERKRNNAGTSHNAARQVTAKRERKPKRITLGAVLLRSRT
jgi:hypothetical protein